MYQYPNGSDKSVDSHPFSNTIYAEAGDLVSESSSVTGRH